MINKFEIYVNTSPDSGSTLGYGFIHEGNMRTLQAYPQTDFYVPVFLTKTESAYEYVDITTDSTIFVMERQEINPYFLEFSFFDTIIRNEVNNGSDLTLTMINYIRTVRPDIAYLNNFDLITWFDTIGKNEFPWNSGESNQTNQSTLDELELLNTNIVSKAYFNNIDVNS